MLKPLGVLSIVWWMVLVPWSPALAQYTEVPNAPKIDVGQRTLKTWVATTPFGSFLGVFEKNQSDGQWYGLCTTTLGPLPAPGEEAGWIDSQLPTLNNCLRSAFSGPSSSTPEGRVNGTLFAAYGFTATLGVPSLGRR